MTTIASNKKRGALVTLRSYVLALIGKRDINEINTAEYDAAIYASRKINELIKSYTNNKEDYESGILGETTDPYHRIITRINKKTGLITVNIDVWVSTNNGIDYTITGNYTLIALNGVQIPISEVVSMPRVHPELTQEQIYQLKK